jgi:putative membrane protein
VSMAPVSMAPRHLHPLSPILAGAIGFLRSWPILVIAVARSSWGIVVALAVALVAWRTVVWARTTWSIGADGLVVRTGVLRRDVQTVPPQRVQQVELRQAIRHRATGLAAVRVGLAGGGDSQVDLDALSLVDAKQLHDVLERWRSVGSTPAPGGPAAATLPPPTAASPPTVLLTVHPRHLVVAGLTSRSLWLAPLAALVALVQFLGDVRLTEETSGALRSRLGDASPLVTGALVVTVVMFFAVATTVVTNHALTVLRSGPDLIVRRGLLERRSVVVPRRRVQAVQLGTNLVRERLGLASVVIKTADLGGTADAASSISVPIGERSRLEQLLPELLLTADPATPTRRHPAASVRREIIRRLIRAGPASVVVGLLTGGAVAVVAAVVIGLAAAIATGWVAGRRRRSGWNRTTVVTESGLISWRRSIVPFDRLQSVATVQNPFQRRLELMTVRLDVAGVPGGVELRDLAVDDAHRLVAGFDPALVVPEDDIVGALGERSSAEKIGETRRTGGT